MNGIDPMTIRKEEILQNVSGTALPLVIYGTGAYAQQIYSFLKKHEITLDAACVDTDYYSKSMEFWNGIPVYPVDELHAKLVSFNIVVGFYDLKLAQNRKISGCKEIFYLENKSTLAVISDLPKTEERMRHYFNDNGQLLKIKNIIHLYFACLSSDVKFVDYNEQNDEIHMQTKEGVHLITNRYFAIFDEIFCEKIYAVYKRYIKNEYVIFDIGANRGYSALFFAQEKSCQRVFSFEPDTTTIEFMYRNLALNHDLAEKIKPYNYGLYDKNEMLTFYQPLDGSDGVNSSEMEFAESYWSADRKRLMQEKTVTVRRASEVVTEILSQFEMHSMQKIIKIDIEGAEYKVLAELRSRGILADFSIIFGECHLGMEGILDICNLNFNLVHLEKEPIDGCYNFVLVNKEQCVNLA